MTVELIPSRKTARLPVTSCEPRLREEVKEIAEQNGVSESQVVRVAVRFFLDHNVGKTDIKLWKTNKKNHSVKASQS